MAKSSTLEALARMRSLHEIYEVTKSVVSVEVEEDYFMINEEPASYIKVMAEVNWQRAMDEPIKLGWWFAHLKTANP